MLSMGFQCFKYFIDFLNSQFVSSMLGALLAAVVAIYIARVQSKEQLKLLKEENKNQKNFLEEQEKNERERIYIQYSVERAHNAIKCVESLSKYHRAFVNMNTEFDKIKENFVSKLPRNHKLGDKNIQNDITVICIEALFLDFLEPKMTEILYSLEQCIVSLIGLDEGNLSDEINEMESEVYRIRDWVNEYSNVKTEEEYRKYEEKLLSNNLYTVCTEIKIILLGYIVKQIAELKIN